MLELVAEDVTPEDAGSIAGKQINLEHMVTDILSEYKELKSKIFKIVERSRPERNQPTQHLFPN